MSDTTELLQGTLDLLILKAVSLAPLHGYGVLLRIQQISQNRLLIQHGSLYPALYRLEHQALITSEGANPRTGGRRSTTASPRLAGAGSRKRRRTGDGSRRRSGSRSKRRQRTYETDRTRSVVASNQQPAR